LPKGIVSEVIADEWLNDLGRDIDISRASKSGDCLSRKVWPRLRHVQPTIASETGKQDVGKAKDRSRTTCTHILH
jgi:hypothetical protein